jgi:hypothetical protein
VNFYRKGGRKIAIYLLLMMFIVSWFLPTCFCTDAIEASTAINQAEETLNLAYIGVAKAEADGADISLLLDELDAGGVFLSAAHSAFRSGDFESAFSSAVACSSAVNGVADDAARLDIDAKEAHINRLFLTAVASGISVCFILIIAFFGWKFLKRWYSKRGLAVKY